MDLMRAWVMMTLPWRTHHPKAEVVQERWGLPATKWLKVFKPAQP